MSKGLEEARALDAADPLRHLRSRFQLPSGVTYLDGNSLGPLPRGVAARVAAVIQDEWRDDLIRAWNSHDWMDMPQRVGARIAPLIGARPAEVMCADSTSINLFKLMAAALKMRPGRRVIVSEKGNFPTDVYMAEGLRDLLDDGVQLRLIEDDDVDAALDDQVAVVCLTQVDYRTGRKLDMPVVTDAVHRHGALMLWDLAHSAGAFPVALDAAHADLAVGCGYKYLNGGPGAPAFLFVAARHHQTFTQPLSGWLGHAEPFAFEPSYRPASGVRRAICGTPAILSMAALEAALEAFDGVDLGALQRKSIALSELFIEMVDARIARHGFELASPRDPLRRGSQVSVRHPHGYPIMQALIARQVVGDFRAPDVLRFGFAPLYTRFEDVWVAVEALDEIMSAATWDRPEFHRRAAVT